MHFDTCRTNILLCTKSLSGEALGCSTELIAFGTNYAYIMPIKIKIYTCHKIMLILN